MLIAVFEAFLYGRNNACCNPAVKQKVFPLALQQLK